MFKLSSLQLWQGYSEHNWSLEENRDAGVIIQLLACCGFRYSGIPSAPASENADTSHHELFHYLSSQPALVNLQKEYKLYQPLTSARLELGMILHPLVLLGTWRHHLPSTAAGAGLLSVLSSCRAGQALHPTALSLLAFVSQPTIRLRWITKSSLCIAGPWHRWAMTLGHDPLMIEVNQRTTDGQKRDY